MKVLMINKFLYPKGGAETYVIKLGKKFEEKGHEVQYFGMKNKKNILKNRYELYVKEKDFSKKSILNIGSLINNREAYKKMTQILFKFKPDLIISNNIEYHLTPSIIEAFRKYKKENEKVKWIYVAHDYQIICPSHGLFDTNLAPCEKCLSGNYFNCFKTKCMKNSRLKSLIASLDSWYWHCLKKIYVFVDYIICPSIFMKEKIDKTANLKDKTIVIHNFLEERKQYNYKKKNYVIYFGALTETKGIKTLIETIKLTRDINYLIAGEGPLKDEIRKLKNVNYVGFKEEKELKQLIGEALFSIYPSEWNENCPFSVIESQMYGTPVIGANIGGIPELIEVNKTGELFEPKNVNELKDKIVDFWNNRKKLEVYSENCKNIKLETANSYYEKIMKEVFNENI